MNDPLIDQVRNLKTVKYIFCDYYDTIVHRRVHPLKPFKIWAKTIKKELQLKKSVDELYDLRRSTMNSLRKSLDVTESEVPYKVVMQGIYDKLGIGLQTSFDEFMQLSYETDYHAEESVQYVNQRTIASLQKLKDEGYIIFCVSDFHADEAMLLRLMQFHGVATLYDKIYVSASQKASKENKGLIFKKIMEKEGMSPEHILMVGDNPVSDVANAKRHGIESHYLKRKKYKIRQKFQYLLLRIGI